MFQNSSNLIARMVAETISKKEASLRRQIKQIVNLFVFLVFLGIVFSSCDRTTTSSKEQLLYDSINESIQRGDYKQALVHIEQALTIDPNKPELLFAWGRILDELGQREKSLLAYDAAIVANPEYFDAYFNKAVIYYNSAIRIIEEANGNMSMTSAEYDRKINLIDEEFAKSIPLFEKAHELNPIDEVTMEALKILYYRFKIKYPEYEEKYDNISKRLGK